MPAAEEETEEVISERKWVMQYLDSNKIEDSLNDVLNVVVQSQPLDPFVVMSDLLKAKSEKQNGILNVLARGDRVLALVSGHFGQGWVATARKKKSLRV